MSIESLDSGSASSGSEQFSFLVDYDTVAETIGLTCTGTGHAQLTVAQTSNGTVLGALSCDQYGTATGGNVTYTGQRVIVLGPGATGIQTDGSALPTRKVSSNVVGAFNVPKGQTPGLEIDCGWGPNSNS